MEHLHIFSAGQINRPWNRKSEMFRQPVEADLVQQVFHHRMRRQSEPVNAGQFFSRGRNGPDTRLLRQEEHRTAAEQSTQLYKLRDELLARQRIHAKVDCMSRCRGGFVKVAVQSDYRDASTCKRPDNTKTIQVKSGDDSIVRIRTDKFG